MSSSQHNSSSASSSVEDSEFSTDETYSHGDIPLKNMAEGKQSILRLSRPRINQFKERVKSMALGGVCVLFLMLTYQLYHHYLLKSRMIGNQYNDELNMSVRDANTISTLMQEIQQLKKATQDLQMNNVSNSKEIVVPKIVPVQSNTVNLGHNSENSNFIPVQDSITTPVVSVTPVTPVTPVVTTPVVTTPAVPVTPTPVATPTTPVATPTTPVTPTITTTTNNNNIITTLPNTGLPGIFIDTYPVPTSAPMSQTDMSNNRAFYLSEWTKFKTQTAAETAKLPAMQRIHGTSPFKRDELPPLPSSQHGGLKETPVFTNAPMPFPAAPRPADSVTAERRDKVKDMIKHAWDGYSSVCFGKDELNPISETCNQWLGMGITIIDSLSTLWLAGLHEEYNKAAKWVQDELDIVSYPSDVSFFESTIRIVGGLMSAYDLSGDERFVLKAVAVSNALHVAYTPTGMPHSRVNLRQLRRNGFGWAGGHHILAEIGTIQIEFLAVSDAFKKIYNKHHKGQARKDVKFKEMKPDAIIETLKLSKYNTLNEKILFDSPLHIEGNTPYFDLAHGVFDILNNMAKPRGLYPTYISTNVPYHFTNQGATMGGLGDSFYEYLLKMWIGTGRKHEFYRKMYLESMDGVQKLQYAELGGTGYIGPHDGGLRQSMDHLSCFSGGMLALGVHTGAVTDPILAGKHLRMAEQVTRTCALSYFTTPTGLGPDHMGIRPNGELHSQGQAYLQRPETVESLFILWRVTKDPIYREWGWNIVQAIENNTKRNKGYASLRTVYTINQHQDRQETFLLAETFKYLFLLFSDDNAIDLTQWVFNTEAHPVRARQVELPTKEEMEDARAWAALRSQQYTPNNAKNVALKN